MDEDTKDQVQPLAMVSSDYAGFSCKGQEVDRILEGKMLKIAQILGISLEGRLGQMSFIRQMIHQEKVNCQQQAIKESRKK